MDIKLTVPFAEELAQEVGWTKLDRSLYFVARFHLQIEQKQMSDFAVGDILRTYRTTPHSETEVVEVFEEEMTTVDLKETTRSVALSQDVSQRVTAALAGAAKSPFYEVSGNIGTLLESSIRSSINRSVRSSATISRRERITFTVHQVIRAGAPELQLAVAGYRKYRRDIYLHYIDYLFVQYRRAALGLRRKKRSLPRPVGTAHINLIPIHMPLFRLLYWNLESESSLLYTETEYQNLTRVSHPDRVTFQELHTPMGLPTARREEPPTLYALSNVAFPLRRIDHPGPWTRQELEQIEGNEAEGSAWWFPFGAGRKN